MANREELRIIRAARAGQADAQLALGKLYLTGSAGLPCSQPTALHWLERAARQGSAEAGALAATLGAAMPPAPADASGTSLAPADDALLDAAWEARQRGAYLQRALPLARALAQGADMAGAARLGPAEATLLSRCARALAAGPAAHQVDGAELQRFWELAAAAHERHAQMALGLWCARMRPDGSRTAGGAGSVNFKKAIRWLAMAGEQGLAEAWYALSRIYIKPEFSQRNVLDAQRYLERAAEMGHRDAQFECGNNAWRARRENEANDVRAVYWLQKAARGGCDQAGAALRKIAPPLSGPAHAGTGALAVPAGLASSHPLLAARLELAALFRLTRAEALLLDVRQADHGHCLVVDIRASYGRSKRRLVLVDTAQQRHALDRIGRLFEDVDCGPGGPEGNYRQRLYRLKTLAPGAAGEVDLAA
jgi:TPR repeat protein